MQSRPTLEEELQNILRNIQHIQQALGSPEQRKAPAWSDVEYMYLLLQKVDVLTETQHQLVERIHEAYRLATSENEVNE